MKELFNRVNEHDRVQKAWRLTQKRLRNHKNADDCNMFILPLHTNISELVLQICSGNLGNAKRLAQRFADANAATETRGSKQTFGTFQFLDGSKL